jgi:phytoene synthase
MTSQLKIFKNNSKTFSFAASLLHQGSIQKITALYCFCRFIDDVADENADPAGAAILIRSYITDVLNDYSTDSRIDEFIAFSKSHLIPKHYIVDLLEGVLSDCTDGVHLKNETALLSYAYCVAGTVGAMMCSLLGIKEDVKPAALLPAIHLGIAMQLTNIARDIQEDAENNRVYIPLSWQLLVVQALVHMPIDNTQNATKSCKKILDLADEYYVY